jgi:carbon monoxide dehydrogenase subunit G
MHVKGSYTFDAPRQAVWEHLLNAGAFKDCIPNCRNFEDLGSDHYRATVRVGVGPLRGAASGRFQLTDQQAPDQLRVQGRGGGGPFKATGGGFIRLEEQAGRTVVTYEGEAHVTGRAAFVGDRVLSIAARGIITQFFKCMERRLAENGR